MSFPVHDVNAFAILSTLVAALFAVLRGLRMLRDSAASKLKGSLPPGPVGLPILGMCSMSALQIVVPHSLPS